MPGDYYIAHLNTGNHQLIWTDLSVDDLVNFIVEGKDKIYIANYSYKSAEEALEESKLFCTNGLDELKFTVELNANREITKLFHINDITLTTSPIKLTAYSRSSYYISDDKFDEKILMSLTSQQQAPHVFFANSTSDNTKLNLPNPSHQ
ncbi:hypothetical protein L3V82_05040 [Thiotrichales bacterium 19S3-7]|nr:hypothetical protein [Thiotrichales bacterium 19S3-7]MCF6801458.1 hypothetical protein [Thiotrichales bacterium 19S3-11]